MHLKAYGGLLHTQLPSSAHRAHAVRWLPNSCLPDARTAVVCDLLKDGAVAAEDEAIVSLFTLRRESLTFHQNQETRVAEAYQLIRSHAVQQPE